ncbi:MAG: aldo/keto reductase [Kiritimatiellales bacterium]|nr:aldo/keto reductase [Kiritimatiellales bacterium]
MIYKEYGKTGKRISAISAGNMRHRKPEDMGASAATMLRAYELGVNYFDTAPYYCDDRSEDILGHAVRQMKPGTFYVSTKSMESTGAKLRDEIERSLERIGVDTIDFFYIWCVRNKEGWEQRKAGGALDAALQAKEDGLIKHLVLSSHMTYGEADSVIDEGIFEGILLGYNAINFPVRQQSVNKAHEAGLGVVTMNPLAGGVIPQNPERFDFLRGPNDRDVISAALRFNVSQPAVTSALVGFSCEEEVEPAIQALENFEPYSSEYIRALGEKVRDNFAGLCTGCGYCLPCPVDIPIPYFMDVYNRKILCGGDETLPVRLKYQWDIEPTTAATCAACGQCEEKCTQHLPIIERLEYLSKIPPMQD